jgi:hypothetical protein
LSTKSRSGPNQLKCRCKVAYLANDEAKEILCDTEHSGFYEADAIEVAHLSLAGADLAAVAAGPAATSERDFSGPPLLPGAAAAAAAAAPPQRGHGAFKYVPGVGETPQATLPLDLIRAEMMKHQDTGPMRLGPIPHEQHHGLSNSGLANARPVDEEEGALARAEAVDAEGLARRKKHLQERNQKLLGSCVLLVVVVGLVIRLGTQFSL